MELNESKLKSLGTVLLPELECKNCHEKGTTEMTVSVNNLQIIFIPAFSLGKAGSAKCTKCLLETKQNDFSEEQKTAFHKIKSNYKIPLSHYSLSIVLIVLIGISFLFSVTGNAIVDPREKQYEEDLTAMGTQKQQPQDTLAGKFLTYMNQKANALMRPEEMACFTRRKDDKVLFLVTIPSYKLLPEKSQEEVVDLITGFTAAEKSLEGKKLYLAVYGLLDLVKYYKTPTEEGAEGGYTTDLALYEFYGTTPASK
jgi:hypothetical protein